MLLGAVAAQSVAGNFKLASTESKGHEAENPDNQTDGLGTDIFDATNLVVVVSKVQLVYVYLGRYGHRAFTSTA